MTGLTAGISASLLYILRRQASKLWLGSLSNHLVRSTWTPSVGLKVANASSVLSYQNKHDQNAEPQLLEKSSYKIIWNDPTIYKIKLTG